MSISKLHTANTVKRMQAAKTITEAKIRIPVKTLTTAKTTTAATSRDRKTTLVATSPRTTKITAARVMKSSSATSTSSTTSNRSPFSSFITTGLRVRNRSAMQSSDFAYDLSPDELRFMGTHNSSVTAMKAVPDGERELLKSGQRGAYLALRYERSPDRKYNFPEATSWRIGWLHNQQLKQATR